MTLVAVLVIGLLAAAATSMWPPRRPSAGAEPAGPAEHVRAAPTTWVYQLQGYGGDLTEVAGAGADVAVIDLAHDARSSWFTREEVGALQGAGTTVLAYFEIGSIENFRPEAKVVRRAAPDLVLNRWDDWPEENFVTYWDERWWDLVVRPRVDQALAAGFDGVYLDTPLAYEEIDLKLVPGTSRDTLARRMVDLIVRIGDHARASDPGFLVVPQNSPELRTFAGYVDAIDGIGMEELFVLATDEPCTQDWCEENLENTRALKAAGKFVLAVDYADDPALVALACRRYAEEGFAGYVGPVELNTVRGQCPG